MQDDERDTELGEDQEEVDAHGWKHAPPEDPDQLVGRTDDDEEVEAHGWKHAPAEDPTA